MRHVSLDLTLTDEEASELIRRIRREHNTVSPRLNEALDELQFQLQTAMCNQPENILFFAHDSDAVIEQRKLCDGTGKVE